MTIDLDALEALEKKATQGPWTPKCFAGENWQCVYPDEEHDTSIGSWENMALIAAARNALPELIRLARIGQRVERDAKRPDPMSQYLNEGDGVYRP